LWDLTNDPHSSIALIETMVCTGRPLALVGHGSGVLRYTRASNGRPLVAGESVTGFSNLEEAASEMTDVVPFLVEEMLRNNGANYSRKHKWQPHAVSDGDLITGQNPASSEAVAHTLLDRLRINGEARKVASSRRGARL
jgi:putative intracellular protease/amidase